MLGVKTSEKKAHIDFQDSKMKKQGSRMRIFVWTEKEIGLSTAVGKAGKSPVGRIWDLQCHCQTCRGCACAGSSACCLGNRATVQDWNGVEPLSHLVELQARDLD